VRDQISSAQKVINQFKMQQQELERENKRLQLENSNLKDDMMLHSSKCGGIHKIMSTFIIYYNILIP
jgi:regulator of replication initiation timing